MALTNPNAVVKIQQLVEFKTQLEVILQSKSISSISGLAATTVEGAIAELVNKIAGLGSVYNVKGSVADYAALTAITTKNPGDVYNVVAAYGDTPAGTNYVWTGTEWDALGGTIDLSDYITKTMVASKGNSKKPVYFDSDGLIQECEAFINTSAAAAENGTTLSLVTTGEKYSWNQKYDKPSAGIPKTDLAQAVQDSLDLADSALQEHQDISGKADKVANATNGNFAGVDANGNITDSGYKAADFQAAGNYKTTQEAVSDPTASGTSVEFISGITQNANGEITPLKKTVATASSSAAGLMSASQCSKLDAISYATDADIDEIFGITAQS